MQDGSLLPDDFVVKVNALRVLCLLIGAAACYPFEPFNTFPGVNFEHRCVGGLRAAGHGQHVYGLLADSVQTR